MNRDYDRAMAAPPPPLDRDLPDARERLAAAEAPPPLPAPPPDEEGRGVPAQSGAGRRARGVLRSIRVDAQDLRRSVENISVALETEGAKPADVAAAIRAEDDFRAKNTAQIQARFAQAESLLEAHLANNPAGGGDVTDDLTAMENAWERLVAAWPSAPADDDLDLPTVRRELATVQRYIDELVYIAARVTIPARLQESLGRLRVGGTLDFHYSFADELPEFEDRRRLLEYLARYPGSFSGVIDPETGIIRRIAPTRARRLFSYVLMVLLVAGGALLVVGLTVVGTNAGPGWLFTPARLAELLGAYFALMAGAVAHVAVDAIKQYRANKGSSRLLALEDMLLWGHVHEAGILISIVSLWAVLIGLVAVLDEVLVYTAFLAGYSWDSLIDIFLARFEKQVSSAGDRLAQQLSP